MNHHSFFADPDPAVLLNLDSDAEHEDAGQEDVGQEDAGQKD